MLSAPRVGVVSPVAMSSWVSRTTSVPYRSRQGRGASPTLVPARRGFSSAATGSAAWSSQPNAAASAAGRSPRRALALERPRPAPARRRPTEREYSIFPGPSVRLARAHRSGWPGAPAGRLPRATRVLVAVAASRAPSASLGRTGRSPAAWFAVRWAAGLGRFGCGPAGGAPLCARFLHGGGRVLGTGENVCDPGQQRLYRRVGHPVKDRLVQVRAEGTERRPVDPGHRQPGGMLPGRG